jgi:hypothetical protein
LAAAVRGLTMDKVQQFRHRASECQEQAAVAVSPEIKSHYLGVARMWEKLAEERLTYFIGTGIEASR